MKRIPPDPKQCQAEKPNGHTFMTLGGQPGYIRCTSVPTILATELKPGPDGIKGRMTLCHHCASVLELQAPGVAKVELLVKGWDLK